MEAPGLAELNAIRNGQLFRIEHGPCRTLFDYTTTNFIAKQRQHGIAEGFDQSADEGRTRRGEAAGG